MQFSIATPVAQDYRQVAALFNQSLFEQLRPTGIGLKVLRFDGCKKGDVVELKLYLLGFIPQYWKSTVTENGERDGEWFFVDEGTAGSLPFFLRRWRHTHRILQQPDQPDSSIIVDHIEFEGIGGLSALWYPILRMQFAQRRPVYQRIFGRCQP